MLVRMHRIEQKLDIHSAPPRDLEQLLDPFDFYDEACKEYYAELSNQPRLHGKAPMDVDDEEYREDDDGDDDDDDDGGGGDQDNDEDYDDE